MCGICGIWNKPDKAAVESMIAAMRHRGPDDCGVFGDERVSLGMARLSILDLSPTGHQPMSNPEQTIWIVYNGEAYNFQSERQLLKKMGYAFLSTSDTEVILRMYERYGDDFLLRLRGMFALAIYDRRGGPGRERLLLARDPLGIKPLLYTEIDGRLIFASEIRTLLASRLVPREVDADALRLLLTFGSIYQPHTILRGVKMLLPAHRMIVEHRHTRIERYWSFGLDRLAGLRQRPYSELVDEVADILQESVRLHMLSDVPVGAFLSGGVDSSLLVGLMTRLAGRRIKTFSVGFEEEGKHLDESDEAGATAAFLGADHTRVVVTGEDMRQHITRIAAGLDQPTVDGVNSYFVSMAARQAVTVAVSGTGGDEVFAGYPWFTQMAMSEQRLRSAPLRMAIEEAYGWLLNHPLMDRRLSGERGRKFAELRARYGFLPRYAQTYHIFGPWHAGRLLAANLRGQAGIGCAMARDIQATDELPHAPAVERVSALVMRGYLCNQLLRDIDTASMSHSLEVRVPFLDVPLIDLAFSLPLTAKIGDVRSIENPYQATYQQTGCKRILVDAGKRLGVLRMDIDRQPKRGFTYPFEPWLKGPLRPILEDTLSPAAVQVRGLFDAGAASQVLRDFREQSAGWAFPWLLMMVELWAREVLDR